MPLVFDSPHSGLLCPEDFQYACRQNDLYHDVDRYIEDLFSSAPHEGAALLYTDIIRSYIDLNRAVDDIDPSLLASPWPFGEINPTPRSHAGIGLIRRLVKPGIPLYDRFLSASEIKHRIEHYYHPYHEALETLLDDAHYAFGQVWHINCHSMSSRSAIPKRPIGLHGNRGKAVDFCLGDRDGTTCSRDFMYRLRTFIKSLGYTVTVNDPFKGVEIIERTSDPSRGRHSVQIEINKALYMNEKTFEKLKHYDSFKNDVRQIVSFCANYVREQCLSQAAD